MSGDEYAGHEKDVVHPDRYGGDSIYETVKTWEDWGIAWDAYLANCLKYITRFGKKEGVDPLRDMLACRFYLERCTKLTPQPSKSSCRLSPRAYAEHHKLDLHQTEMVIAIRQGEPFIALQVLDVYIQMYKRGEVTF